MKWSQNNYSKYSLYLDAIFNRHILYIKNPERIKFKRQTDGVVPKLWT